MQFFQDAKLKAGVWLREQKEKAEARRALRSVGQSEHGHGRFFLLHVPAAATICAAIVEWYWALLFCIEATGHIDWNFETAGGTTQAFAPIWNFAFSAHWPVLVGLLLATVPIVMLSMVWLPVQFSMRGAGRWRRGTVIFVGILANLLVIVSGTIVMNYNRQEQVRDAVVVEQTAAQGRAAIDARLAFEQEQLRLALNNSNPYLNQAANVGAEEWERSYVAQARATNDARLPMLERALGAARAADQRRANIERLTVERATAAPEAASAANVEDTVGRELNTFAQYVEVWRPPFIALICTAIGIFGAWWVLALMQGLNPRDVLRSGWADESHRIEDKREEAPIASEPMKPPREVVTDAETGEELIRITPKPHWRKQKGKRQKVETQPDIPPDESGVSEDGGNRTAVTIGGVMEVPSVESETPDFSHGPERRGEQEDTGDKSNAPEGEQVEPHQPADDDIITQPELSLPELTEADFELATSEEIAEPEHADNNVEQDVTGHQPEAEDNEQPSADQTEPSDEREPETRDDRLITTVAAE